MRLNDDAFMLGLCCGDFGMRILQVPSQKDGTFSMLTCCFIGHRNFAVTKKLTERVNTVILDLLDEGVEVFYFGSRSQFNDLCYQVVTKLKKYYKYIKRVYVRAEYQYIDSDYKNYLLQFYEDTFYPPQLEGSGKLAYVKRNRIMIDASDYCVFYYDPDYTLPDQISKYNLTVKASNSGTKLAYEYAVRKNKNVMTI